jgi:NAD(P)-dependent dehydrogenase (short-subunit alcohol dehydrogenase family)
MARIFITGSADGLGLLAAKKLISEGHQVMLHARNKNRADEALRNAAGAESVLIGDLSSIAATKRLAAEANASGSFDAVIHNAGVYQVDEKQISTDGFPLLLAVNTLAPYILTCLMNKPKRLIYLSSGMHMQGDPSLKGLMADKPYISYSDSKLHDLILAKIVAEKWSDVYSNAVDPGWVPTKMGGTGAPDNLQKGYETQAWLAVSNDKEALVSGRYLHHQKDDRYRKEADELCVQKKFLEICEKLSGVKFPAE